MIKPSPALVELRSKFQEHGFNLWFVGGCVRDALLGVEPKDIDLCTDADPTQQILIYGPYGYKHFLTGLQHGTITVKLDDELYEITSLRTESEHDGRHATVAYTRDLKEDLSRRDLTINAMAQDFDGNIIDPFGGAKDLDNSIIRFVGNAEERMREDYLRILRFFRFHGRFGRGTPLDQDAMNAILETREGLDQISGERIWLEMSKIIVGPLAGYILHRMKYLHVIDHIDLKRVNLFAAVDCQLKKLRRPSTVLGLILTSIDELEETMNSWKLATSERAEARFANRMHSKLKLRDYKDALVDGANIDWVEEMLKYQELPSLAHWDVPVFPVAGADLIERGYKPGPEFGAILKSLREKWRESRYTLKKNELLI